VNAIAEPFRLSQEAISKHLAYLERSQVIEKTKVGRENICKLRLEAIKAASDWALHYRRFWEESFHKLDSVLAPSHYGFSSDFPSEMFDVVTFKAVGIDKTRLTLQRNHSIAIAEHYGEDQGWNQSLNKLAEVLAAQGRQL
jgi:hypothetical protein